MSDQITTSRLATLTEDRLTELLRAAGKLGPDASVTAVASKPIGTGQMAESHRLTLDVTSGNGPLSVVAKLPSTNETSLQMAANTGAYLREVRFYQEVASAIDVRSPRCDHAAIDDDGIGFELLLEDMGPAVAIDQIVGCDLDRAELVVDQAAKLAASSWDIGALRDKDWLPGTFIWQGLAGLLPAVTEAFLDRYAGYLEPEHVEVVRALPEHAGAWLATLEQPRCLWHGDFRLDNMLFDCQGGAVDVAIVDWQSLMLGPAGVDLAYFLGTSLSADVRAEHERALVDRYHRGLAEHGVTGYSADDAWTDYRRQSLVGLMLTVPVSVGVQQTERGDAMFGTMAQRGAAQVLANDTFAALGS